MLSTSEETELSRLITHLESIKQNFVLSIPKPTPPAAEEKPIPPPATIKSEIEYLTELEEKLSFEYADVFAKHDFVKKLVLAGEFTDDYLSESQNDEEQLKLEYDQSNQKIDEFAKNYTEWMRETFTLFDVVRTRLLDATSLPTEEALMEALQNRDDTVVNDELEKEEQEVERMLQELEAQIKAETVTGNGMEAEYDFQTKEINDFELGLSEIDAQNQQEEFLATQAIQQWSLADPRREKWSLWIEKMMKHISEVLDLVSVRSLGRTAIELKWNIGGKDVVMVLEEELYPRSAIAASDIGARLTATLDVDVDIQDIVATTNKNWEELDTAMEYLVRNVRLRLIEFSMTE